ncbi:hypothetical protein [Rhodoferax sp. GW822-FHT02A01]|uniref:hypothetical protein n=1 Tax=Rhodoferax sp. GW822-FHT02A01 TaxID=3141537 RepID=UPI00315CDE39
MARLIVFLLLACTLVPAWADPGKIVETALIAVAFVNPGTWLAAGSLLVAGVISNSEARRKASASADAVLASYNASLQDRNVTVLRNDSPWQVVYGSPAPVGGTLVAIFSSGDKDQFKHLVVVFAAHECASIDEIYIEGDPLGALDGNGWVTGGAFMDSGAARVNCQKHFSPGGADTADAFLMAAVPDKWTSAHKLSGYTYIVLTIDLNMSRFQGGPPNITAKLRGKKVYDYRTATTGYSTNPALCVADFLTSVYGYSTTSGQIDNAAAIAAANACDAQGFNCNGALSTDASREATLHALEDSMAGRTHWSGGVWRIMAGIWSTPVMTLTDAYLAAPIEVTQAGNPRASRYNSVRGKYIPAAQLGVTVDFTPYVVSSYVTADGPNQWLDVSYGFTGTNSECQKLSAIAVERSRAGLTINYPAHLTAWKLQPGDRVYVTNNELGFAAKTFRVVDWTHINNAPLGLVLTEDVASMYTGTFSIADPLAATSNLSNPYARPAAPAILTANSGTGYLVKLGDGTIQTRVYCTWSATTQRAVLQGGYAQIQWKVTGDPDANYSDTDLSPDSSSAILIGPKDGSNITIKVRYITGVGAYGDWVTITHSVLGKTDLPTNVSSLNIAGKTLSWPAVTDIDLDGYRIKFQYGTNLDWGTASQMHTGLITDSPYTPAVIPTGSVIIMAKAVDTSGNESATAAYVITNLGNALVANVLETFDFDAMGWPGTYTNAAVVGGNLTATQSDPFFGADAGNFYGQDAATFYNTNYDALTWISTGYTPSLAAVGSNMTIAWGITGNSYAVLYRKTGPLPFFGNDASYFYSDDAAPFYSGASDWQTWPGSISAENQEYQFQVTTTAGTVGGQLTAFVVSVDVPDKSLKLNNVAIAPGGTRLTGAIGYFNVIQNIQLTLQGGSTAVKLEINDKSAALGPLITARDSGGTSVAATIDALPQGY